MTRLPTSSSLIVVVLASICLCQEPMQPTPKSEHRWTRTPARALYEIACQMHNLGQFESEISVLEGLLEVSKEDELNAHAGLVLGAHYMEEGKWDKAITALEHVRAKLGDEPTIVKAAWAHLCIGRCHVERGDFDSANRVFESAKTLPGSPRMSQAPIQDAFRELMSAAKAKRKPAWPSALGPQEGDPVEDEFRRACRWTREAEIHWAEELGVFGFGIMEGRERQVRAMALFNKIISDQPGHPRAVTSKRYLADIHFGLGDVNQALKLYREVHATKGADKRDRAWCAFRTAVCLGALGKREEATKAVDAAVVEFPDTEFIQGIPADKVADEFLEYFAQGRSMPVGRSGRDKKEEYEEEASALARAGYTLMCLSQEERAAPILTHVYENYKDSSVIPFVRVELGNYCLRKREWKKAEELLAAVGEVDEEEMSWGLFDEPLPEYPVSAEAAFLTGYAQVMAGEYEKARETFAEAIHLYWDKKRFHIDYTDQFRSLIEAAKMGKPPAFALDPPIPQRGDPCADAYYRALEIYRCKGVTLAQCKAASAALEALIAKPVPPAIDVRARAELGVVHMTMDDWAAAIRCFEEIERKYADVAYRHGGRFGPYAAFMIGRCHVLSAEYDKARAAFESAQKRYPKAKYAYKPWRKWFAASVASAEQRVPTALVKPTDDMLEEDKARDLCNESQLFLDKDKEKAISICQEVVEKYPETYAAAYSYRRLGSLFTKLRRYRESCGAHSKIVEDYTACLSQYSGSQMAAYSAWERARMILKAGNMEKAKEYYQFALDHYFDAKMPHGDEMGKPMRVADRKYLEEVGLINERVLRAEEFDRLFAEKREKRRTAEAKKVLAETPDPDRTSVHELADHIQSLQNLGQYANALDVAETIFRRLKKEDETTCRAIVEVMHACDKAKEYDVAIRAARLIEDNCPTLQYLDKVSFAAEAGFHRVKFLGLKGDHEAAAKAFEQARANYPGARWHSGVQFTQRFRQFASLPVTPTRSEGEQTAETQEPPEEQSIPSRTRPAEKSETGGKPTVKTPEERTPAHGKRGASKGSPAPARVAEMQNLRMKGKYEEALALAETILKEQPNQNETTRELMKLIGDSNKAGQHELAIRGTYLVEERSPTLRFADGVLFAAKAAFARVTIYDSQGDRKKVLDAFNEADKKYPNEKWHNGGLIASHFKMYCK